MSGDTLWCRICQSRQRIIDRHDESFYDGGSGGAHEYAYYVTDLECGHEFQSAPAEVGPAPGESHATRHVPPLPDPWGGETE